MESLYGSIDGVIEKYTLCKARISVYLGSCGSKGVPDAPPKIVKIKLNHTPSGQEYIQLASLNNKLFVNSWDSSILWRVIVFKNLDL